jgi:tRNA A37 threonylcarbamoyladenosine biosynthesis protein TsaE
MDLFRLPGGADAEDLREYVYGDGVCAIEWFERLAEGLEDFLELSLTFVGPQSRRLVAAAHGLGYDRLTSILGGAS